MGALKICKLPTWLPQGLGVAYIHFFHYKLYCTMAYIRSMHTRSTLANIHSIHFICNSFNSWYSLSETVLTSENSSTWLHTVLGQAGSVSFVAFVAFCPELSSGSCFLPFQLFCSASPGRFLVKTRCRTPITLTLYSGWNKGGLIPGALSSHGKAKWVVKRLFGPEVTRSSKGGQLSRPLSS